MHVDQTISLNLSCEGGKWGFLILRSRQLEILQSLKNSVKIDNIFIYLKPVGAPVLF